MSDKSHHPPVSKPTNEIYQMGERLGSGASGIVKEAVGLRGKVAVKVIRNAATDIRQMVYDEIRMLESLKHPHIVQFWGWKESPEEFLIFTELAGGGDLYDRIYNKGKLTEKDASRTIRQVLEAVEYLHTKDIVHRDLKPENLLYMTCDPGSDLVLVDFGIAKHLDSPKSVFKTMAGSIGYAAPEVILKSGHSKPADMWSLGVITYMILCEYYPFKPELMQDLMQEVTENDDWRTCTPTMNDLPERLGSIVFHDRYWKNVSGEAKNFIQTLLKMDPDDRNWGNSNIDNDKVSMILVFDSKAERLRKGIIVFIQ